MRLLVVNWQDLANPHSGGAEVHLHEIFGRLARRGHDVTLLVSGWPGAQGRAEADGMHILRVGTRYTFPLRARRGYDSLCAEQTFDVIVEDINKVPVFTPRWGSTPVVGLVPHLFGTTAFRQESLPVAAAVWLFERAMPRVYADLPMLAISEGTAADLRSRGFDRSNICVSLPGLDPSVFRPGTAPRFDDPTLVYVGRLRRYKGLDVILRSLAILKERGHRVRWIVAGRGTDRGRLEKHARRWGVYDRVEFLGYVSEEDKLGLLQRSWVNVYPSPKEGWGITNVEAAACGTPSVASDSQGLRESVAEGKSGFLVPHGDANAWAEQIEALISDPDLRQRLRRDSLEHARRFDWEVTATEIEELLQSVAERGNP